MGGSQTKPFTMAVEVRSTCHARWSYKHTKMAYDVDSI